jgi:hypothetical protein
LVALAHNARLQCVKAHAKRSIQRRLGYVIRVARIAVGDEDDTAEDDGKDPTPRPRARKAARASG